MAGIFPRSFAWILVGALLFAAFTGLLYPAGAWTRSVTYAVAIAADPAVSWTVSVPRPLGSFSTVASDNVQRVTSLEGLHGGIYNISGEGNGTVSFTGVYSYFDLSSFADVVAVSLSFNETGGSSVWVARYSSNASRTVVFAMTSSVFQSRSDERATCLQAATSILTEGWNTMTFEAGACQHTFPLPSLAVTSLPFLFGALVCMYVGVTRGLKFRWAK